jgi:hypothetical protein
VRQFLALVEEAMQYCLSISHTFTPERFQSTFSTLYKETVPQRTRGALDGELNEIAMFAALQVAWKGNEYPETVFASDMLSQLHRLLHVKRVVAPWGLDHRLKTARHGFESVVAHDLDQGILYVYGKQIKKLTTEEEAELSLKEAQLTEEEQACSRSWKLYI